MSWWFVSSDTLTCAVEVKDGQITWAPPILHRFVGQPAKSLGNWLRSKGDCEFRPMRDFTHTYSWGNNEKRKTMKGRPCRIVARGTAMRSVLIEFSDGQREVTSYRALRQL